MYSCLKTSSLKTLVSTSALSEVSGLDLQIPEAENAPNDALQQNLKFSRKESKVLWQLSYQKLHQEISNTIFL